MKTDREQYLKLVRIITEKYESGEIEGLMLIGLEASGKWHGALALTNRFQEIESTVLASFYDAFMKMTMRQGRPLVSCDECKQIQAEIRLKNLATGF